MGYEGQWAHGKHHGTGKLVFADGRVYEGQFVEGMREGIATLTFADGGVHEGLWRADRRSGFATLTYPDGETIYKGEYHDDLRHGNGTLILGNGRPTQQGIWERGAFKGDKRDWISETSSKKNSEFSKGKQIAAI